MPSAVEVAVILGLEGAGRVQGSGAGVDAGGGWQVTGWSSLQFAPAVPPLGTRVSNKRMLTVVAPERRFWATPQAPPSSSRARPSLLCRLPQGRQQQAV